MPHDEMDPLLPSRPRWHFDPEVSTVLFAPVGHRWWVKELDSEVTTTHRAVFCHAANQFVLLGFWVALFKRTRRIVRRRGRRILGNAFVKDGQRDVAAGEIPQVP